MKSRKSKIIFSALFAVIVGISGIFCGCSSNGDYSFSIDDDGNLIVTYPDGTTSDLGKVEGKDGADGQDGINASSVAIAEAYEKYLSETGMDENEYPYSQFLEEYLRVNADNSAVIGQCLLSSMKVYSEFRYTYTSNTGSWMRPGSTTTIKSVGFTQGSAVIYSMNEEHSYILTNYHVVYYGGANSDNNNGSKIANKIYCYLYGSEDSPEAVVNDSGNAYETDADGYTLYDYGNYGIRCEFIGGSMSADIAVLKAETADILAINQAAKQITAAKSYHVGQKAVAVGNTEGEGISVTEGIVSVDNETICYDLDGNDTINDYEYYRCLRIDTAIYSGNSGGGLFNENGELIGITNAGDTSDENINYAIPVSIATGAADNIIYYYEDGDEETNGVYKPVLGITVASEGSRYVYDQTFGYGTIKETVKIVTVAGGSIAENLGLAAGDVICAVSIDGKSYEINRSFDILDVLYKVRRGSVLKITYERDGIETESDGYTVLASNLVAQV